MIAAVTGTCIFGDAGNVKRLQSFIWRYFYCAFLGLCLGIDSNVQPSVGKFGCIWLEWFARGQGIWLQIFEISQISTLRSASLPAGITLIGALYLLKLVDCRTTWLYFHGLASSTTPRRRNLLAALAQYTVTHFWSSSTKSLSWFFSSLIPALSVYCKRSFHGKVESHTKTTATLLIF